MSTSVFGQPSRLDPESARGIVSALGIDVDAARARLLTGGVSSVVVAIDGARAVVVKQALAHLDVATVWEADPSRSQTEVDALHLFHSITPNHVPDVLASVPDRHVIVMERAPRGWRDWRAVLLARPGPADVDRGRALGRIVGSWHAATWKDDRLRSAFDRETAFDQLRLDPFHRELIRRGVAPADVLAPLIDQLANTRECVVHGDLSPKNVLVGDPGMWVIDAEVAHFGAAVFDVAFLVAHLAVKSFHMPDSSHVLRAVARAFREGYEEANPQRVTAGDIVRHAAAIMAARVHGKSPAAYLGASEAALVASTARAALGAPDPEFEMLWNATDRRDRG